MLMMAEIAIGFLTVMWRIMRICRLQSSGHGRHLIRIVTCHAGSSFDGLGIVGIGMAGTAFEAAQQVEVGQR